MGTRKERQALAEQERLRQKFLQAQQKQYEETRAALEPYRKIGEAALTSLLDGGHIDLEQQKRELDAFVRASTGGG